MDLLSTAAFDFFSPAFAELAAARDADPRPDGPPGSPEFQSWQLRHCERERQRIELTAAAALTTFKEDPAPLPSEGLAEFLDWCRRQQARREARRK